MTRRTSARMECGVCWHVYDPDVGDELRLVDPGTDFGSLPDDWHCPKCDAPRAKFLPVEAGDVDVVTTLRQAFEHVAEAKMRGLPVFNEALRVEAVGFRPLGDGQLGVLVTPWFMSVAFVPEEASAQARLAGRSTVEVELPSGSYAFTVADVPGLGPVATLALLSPMDEVSSQDVGRATAETVLAELLRPQEDAAPARPAQPDAAPDRRGFLRGAWG